MSETDIPQKIERIVVRYDDHTIELTPRVVEALREYMRAVCEMMAEREPENADCWKWGRCVIGDMSNVGCLEVDFGGLDEDVPPDTFVVVSEANSLPMTRTRKRS